MATPVKLALVGCGWISRQHINGYKDLISRGCREFDISACCDPVEERARQKAAEIAEFQGHTPAVVTSVPDLIAADIAEAADVCVPHYCHHSVAAELLKAGIHTMVEKPVGITVRATKAIIEAAAKADRVLAAAENIRRYNTARACAWALRDQQLIGDVKLVNIQSINHQIFDFENPAFKWRGIKLLTGGGMIMDSGAHFADMIKLLFGKVADVYCTFDVSDTRMIADAPVLRVSPADVEDTWHAVIRFESGLHVTWTYSRSLHGPAVSVGNYYGSDGTMTDLGFVFHPFQRGGQIVKPDGSVISNDNIVAQYMESLDSDAQEYLFPYGSTDGFAIEVYDFIRAIRTGVKPEMDGEDALRAKTLCEACYESAVAGTFVAYDDVLNGDVDAYQRPIDAYWKLR
jgi:predicted dehydrogenase